MFYYEINPTFSLRADFLAPIVLFDSFISCSLNFSKLVTFWLKIVDPLEAFFNFAISFHHVTERCFLWYLSRLRWCKVLKVWPPKSLEMVKKILEFHNTHVLIYCLSLMGTKNLLSKPETQRAAADRESFCALRRHAPATIEVPQVLSVFSFSTSMFFTKQTGCFLGWLSRLTHQ